MGDTVLRPGDCVVRGKMCVFCVSSRELTEDPFAPSLRIEYVLIRTGRGNEGTVIETCVRSKECFGPGPGYDWKVL